MSGLSFLLILPAIMLFMVFLDMTSNGVDGNSQVLESGRVLNTAKDLEADIVTGKEIIQSEAEKWLIQEFHYPNSRQQIKKDIQVKMDQIATIYQDNDKLDVECNITSVGNSEDPFAVEVNSSIKV